MVTKPKPIWERWLIKNKEKSLTLYYVLIVLLNAFIVLGLILFFVFLLSSRT